MGLSRRYRGSVFPDKTGVQCGDSHACLLKSHSAICTILMHLSGSMSHRIAQGPSYFHQATTRMTFTSFSGAQSADDWDCSAPPSSGHRVSGTCFRTPNRTYIGTTKSSELTANAPLFGVCLLLWSHLSRQAVPLTSTSNLRAMV